MLHEGMATYRAHVFFVVVMDPHVISQSLFPSVRLLAYVALMDFFSYMFDHVLLDVSARKESLFAETAREILLPDVNFLHVRPHFAGYMEFFTTDRAIRDRYCNIVNRTMMNFTQRIVIESLRAKIASYYTFLIMY